MRPDSSTTHVRAAEHRRRWVLPWTISVALHALALAALTAIVVGSGVFDRASTSPPQLVIDFLDPSTEGPTGTSASSSASTTAPASTEHAQPSASSELDRRIQERLAHTGESADQASPARDPLRDRLRERLAPATTAPLATLANDAPPATFLGLRSSSAGSIAYVVDASGSMIGTLPIVLDELERSLRKLAPTQRFAVLFFQRNGVLTATSELALARPATIDDAIAWAKREVRPAGRSNPLPAIERALAMHPDVVFVLSTAITGSGEFELSREELLARLDTLNGYDSQAARRPTRIQCVQFLDADPLDTLRQIATQHGGSDGFRFLSRAALGLEPAQP